MTQRIHLIGINGSGLSAIAQVLLERGYIVSGSDRQLGPLTRELSRLGATIHEGHQASAVAGADLVVRSSAIPDENPEVQAARAAGIPVLKRSDFLGQLTAGQKVIAIAGTHGKTTTTAMVAWLLTRLGLDPSFIIGGVSRELGGNAHAGKGDYFVIEADEYDRMFLGLSPSWIILTYLEHDHPDCYPTLDDYRQAFRDFVHRLIPGGSLLASRDQTETAAMLERVSDGSQGFTYGLSEPATAPGYQARDIRSNHLGGSSFNAWVVMPGQPARELAQVNLKLPGRHNVQNALAALSLADQLGLNIPQAAEALAEFSGTGRRFELVGEAEGVAIYNDYAHHPTEIRATLAAARQRYPDRRIWAVWQPHTYSRTQTLFDEFARAFGDADRVIVTEIYAAREQNPGFSSRQLVHAMTHPHASFAATLADAAQQLLDQVQPGDIIFVCSAGDADQISQQVFQTLSTGEKHHGEK